MLSIIVSWRDREELGKALPGFLGLKQYIDVEVIVVDFAGNKDMLLPQIEGFENEVTVVTVSDEKFFNKAAAQNVGASQARYDTLFFCDCDIILDTTSFVELYKSVTEKTGLFGTLAGVTETNQNSRGGQHVVSFGYHLTIKTRDGRVLEIIDNEEDAETGQRQAPGLLLVKKADFLTINGYNSQLHGWGWEDQDMISRLTLGAGLSRVNHGVALHISHDDDARIAHYPEVSSRWESRDRMFRTALANYDAANFQGSFKSDVERLTFSKSFT